MLPTTIPNTEPRPADVVVDYDCDHCGRDIQVTLQAWKDYDHPGVWSYDTVNTVSKNDRLCEPCLERMLDGMERAREYQSDVPADWFDPGYAGETW